MAKKKVQRRTRRQNGEGSIYQRSRDGRWVGYLTVGYGDNGNPKRKFVYGKSQSEVAKKLSDITGRVKSLTYDVVEKENLGNLMFDWLMAFKKNSIKPRSFEGNLRNFNKHIRPYIGNMKVYEVDTYVVQRVLNILMDKGYSIDSIKKVKHILNQFFEYAIDNKWIVYNPTHKIKLRKNALSQDVQQYKALSKEGRVKFLEALNRDNANFIKPLCIVLLFAGLRIGEAIGLKWEDVNFEGKTLKVKRSVSLEPIFDSNGKLIERKTIIGATKTTCSVREIPLTDIVVEELEEWMKKQINRQNTNPDVTTELVTPNSFIFANDDGSVRTYSGCRKIFSHFIKRNHLEKYDIHFHGLRHTFSNMLFEMNENPKAIQQLLGHRDVKTTITVYNSVDNEYIRASTDRLNEKIKEITDSLEKDKRQEQLKEKEQELVKDMSDDEYDDFLQELIVERKKRKQKDFEM